MDILALIGIVLVVLGLLGYVPLVLGLILGIVLIVAGGAPRVRRGGW